MADITNRVVLLFQHPKKLKEDESPTLIGVTIPWVILNGAPVTKKGKPWIFLSTEIVQ